MNFPVNRFYQEELKKLQDRKAYNQQLKQALANHQHLPMTNEQELSLLWRAQQGGYQTQQHR